MSIPPLAPFPEADVRERCLPREWDDILKSWETVVDLYLRLDDTRFTSLLQEPESLERFLVPLFKELAKDANLVASANELRKKCFFLLHRIWSGKDIPGALLNWSLVADVCHAFPKSERLRVLLQGLWKKEGSRVEGSLQMVKAALIKMLDSKRPEDVEEQLNRLGPLIKLVPEAGVFMLTGSDFLDSLSAAYPKVSTNLQKKLVTTAYLGLTALLHGDRPNYSLLTDHLYSLKTTAEQARKSEPGAKTFLSDLVTNTPLLNKTRDSATTPEASRLKTTAASLSTFQESAIARPKRIVRRKIDKGKGKAKEDEYGHGAFGEIHVHRISLVTQIQDLFPDLGSGFVVHLLDEYNDSSEEVIAHLLEDNLPPHLARADRSEKLPSTPAASKPHLTPRPTPPPSPPPTAAPTSTYTRRNVFDNDAFDRLAIDASRLSLGRRNAAQTADTLLSSRASASSKSAILSALAAFDSDDDERDDTYDAEDVGGTVDNTLPDGEEADKNEEALYRAYALDRGAFARDADTRRGKARAALKSETGMTDEAIEGWGVMLAREPKRLRRMEIKYEGFSGRQTELASTSYRGNAGESGESGAEGSGQGHRGGKRDGRGRGRGRDGRGGRGGGGRGGGNVAGPSDDKGTQQARQRKDANKGSRANHNRRDQRAKKMARGGFPPAA